MAKLDRLGWTAGLSFCAYGTRFGIRTNDASVLARIHAVLPPGWEFNDTTVVDTLYSLWFGPPDWRKGTRYYNVLYAGASWLARSMKREQVLQSLAENLRLVSDYLAKGFLFVHAGVVGWRGQAILFPGRSVCGTTTLVAALIKAGATYYSDEFAVLDAHGRVHPYAVPLSIRNGNGRDSRKYPVELLTGRAGQAPLPVGLVVVTEYKAGARWQPRNLSPGQAILALMANTVAARRHPEFSLPVLRRVGARAPAIQTKRNEAADAAKMILQRLGSETSAGDTTVAA
jgi:hypothetical protein